jgi:hypothetical protein
MMLNRFFLASFAFSALAADVGSPQVDLRVHEWGTLTAVVDSRGQAVAWSPLQYPSDLPCFVNRLRPEAIKLSRGTVRMETPVLYFYAQRPVTLSVRVDFPRGLLTEWYPRASRSAPIGAIASLSNGRLEWDSVEVQMDDAGVFPQSAGKSRYFAARNTDARPIVAQGDHEKLLFYRGVGNLPVPVQPTVSEDNILTMRAAGDAPIPAMVVFANRGGKIGYSVLHDVSGTREIPLPALDRSEETLRRDLAALLVAQGLYPKEADAMVETWRDAWFEEGTRIFYIVPRPIVDASVRLTVSPAPRETVRVFVGRIELLTPSTRAALDSALSQGDGATLQKYARFLDVFLPELRRRDQGRLIAPAARAFLDQLEKQAGREYQSPSCVQ